MIPNAKVSVLVDNQPPFSSPNTRAVAASLVAGGKPTSDGFLETIEQDASGKPKRSVVWLLEDRQITYPPFEGETISQQELLKRWNDKKWIQDNPHHPIAHQRCVFDQVDILRDFTNSRTPHIKVVRGGRYAIVETERGPDGKPVPTAEGRKMLEKLNQ